VILFFWSNLRSIWNEEFGRGAQLFFYLADEAGNALDVSRQNLNIHEDSLLTTGTREDIGDWQLHLKSMVMMGISVIIEFQDSVTCITIGYLWLTACDLLTHPQRSTQIPVFASFKQFKKYFNLLFVFKCFIIFRMTWNCIIQDFTHLTFTICLILLSKILHHK